MNLLQYKKENNITYQEIAENIGVTGQNPRQTVRRWALGHRKPNMQSIERIAEYTNNKVNESDFNGQTKR